jgi:hypothetical protein
MGIKFDFSRADPIMYDKLAFDGNLSENEQSTDEDLRDSWPAGCFRHAIILLTILIILFISILVWSIRHSNEKYLSPDCGSTPAEAKAKGCHYEPMQRSWIPDECYFSDPSEEYHPFDDREWYADESLTTKLSDSELLQLRNGDDILVFTKFFHEEHCLFAWRKLAIAVERRLPYIDTQSADLHHSTHCSKQVAKMVYDISKHTYNNTDIYTSAPTLFQKCLPLFSK